MISDSGASIVEGRETNMDKNSCNIWLRNVWIHLNENILNVDLSSEIPHHLFISM